MSDTSLRPISMPLADMERLADSIAKSGLFSIQTKDQALALMAIAQAEGRHPALAARDYDIIHGRSAKKAEAMLRDFLASGGKVEWHALTDTSADATFSHPSGGNVRITWDMDRVRNAGLHTKDMYKKYPRQMLRSRVVSEGVRTVCPAATSGMYVPEEIADFDTREPRAPIDVTPPPAPTALPIPSPTTSHAAPPAAPMPPAPPTAPPPPPHDPATGEALPPHTIPIEGRPLLDCLRDWVGAMRSAATHAELAAWEQHNAALLREFERAPKMHARAMRELDDAATRIGADAEMLGADETDEVFRR